MFKTIEHGGREWRWPEKDTQLMRVISSHEDMWRAFNYTSGMREVVQAGGACGVFPYYLAQNFDAVYTFEPDRINFDCLVENTRGLDLIFPFNAAVGDTRDKQALWSLPHEEENAGATQIKPGGHIPTMMIDDLNLQYCDLICLDLEGYELHALYGAISTIYRCSPVIMLESKGLDERCYGIEKGNAEKMLEHFYGYKVVEKVHNDLIMVRQK